MHVRARMCVCVGSGQVEASSGFYTVYISTPKQVKIKNNLLFLIKLVQKLYFHSFWLKSRHRRPVNTQMLDIKAFLGCTGT